MKRVHLRLIDGMRPDALLQLENPFVQELLRTSAYTLEARTVFPSVTLPCHMSLFYSVEPGRHGVTTNIFTPMARPMNGLMEQIHGNRSTAMFYNWNELRDIYRPGNIDYSFFVSQYEYGDEQAALEVCEAAERVLRNKTPDFCFTYIGWVDQQGHKTGWMSPEYLHAVNGSIGLARRLMACTGDRYTTILTADHGGHERTHGTLMEEDMTIPVFVRGEGISPGRIEEPVSILDIAPTVAKLLDCAPSKEWEGRSLL